MNWVRHDHIMMSQGLRKWLSKWIANLPYRCPQEFSSLTTPQLPTHSAVISSYFQIWLLEDWWVILCTGDFSAFFHDFVHWWLFCILSYEFGQIMIRYDLLQRVSTAHGKWLEIFPCRENGGISKFFKIQRICIYIKMEKQGNCICNFSQNWVLLQIPGSHRLGKSRKNKIPGRKIRKFGKKVWQI